LEEKIDEVGVFGCKGERTHCCDYRMFRDEMREYGEVIGKGAYNRGRNYSTVEGPIEDAVDRE